MSTTSDILRKRWSAFSCEKEWPTDVIDEIFIPEALCYADPCAFGDKHQTAVVHATAHLMILSQQKLGRVVGVMKEWQTKELKEAFDTSGLDVSEFFNTTAPGRAFVALRELIPCTPVVSSNTGC